MKVGGCDTAGVDEEEGLLERGRDAGSGEEMFILFETNRVVVQG